MFCLRNEKPPLASPGVVPKGAENLLREHIRTRVLRSARRAPTGFGTLAMHVLLVLQLAQGNTFHGPRQVQPIARPLKAKERNPDSPNWEFVVERSSHEA
jgi:hypothetical protein